VYHGKLQTGQEVAVKVWAARSYSAAKEFHEFEKVCGKYEKCCEHMVKVIGYCEEGDHQISIYEYMPGGTLQQHLHGKGVFDSKTHALDWKTRLQIALHIAQGNY
jgi:serine/threonine protein kinase